MGVNPTAIAFIVFTTVIGALCGATLVGLAVGLGVVLFSTLLDA